MREKAVSSSLSVARGSTSPACLATLAGFGDSSARDADSEPAKNRFDVKTISA
jgi:hypothetical protein